VTRRIYKTEQLATENLRAVGGKHAENMRWKVRDASFPEEEPGARLGTRDKHAVSVVTDVPLLHEDRSCGEKRQNDYVQGNPRRSQVTVQSMAHSSTSGKSVHEKNGALDRSFGK
jgi:hypothetical protein